MNHRLSVSSLLIAALAGSATAQWSQAAPATSPTARSEAALAYDATTGRAILFGGLPAFGSPMSDTWSYNGTTWTQLTPTASPSGRGQAGMVYDSYRGVYVMYGGGNTSFFGGPSLDQTWEFDGTTWTRVFPTNTPGGLAVFGMAYDPIRHRTVLHGGLPDSFFPIDSASTWEYDGNDWTLVTTAATPGPIERPGMCFDAVLGKIVMFGGIDVQIGGTDTTWTYDGVNWAQVNVTGARPAVRTSCKLVYDPNRGVCVLQGGMDPNNGNMINDTWEFDGTNWTQINCANPTPARWGFAMVMDEVRGKAVAFGGLDANYNVINATFEYGATFTTFGSGCAGSNGTPGLTAVNAPRLGSNYAVQISNLATSAAASVMFLGLSNTTSGLGALPLSLAPFGMNGCTLYVSTDAFSLVAASGGTATWSLLLPTNVSLVGLTLYQQALSFDASANAAGMTVSNAATALLGR